MSRTVCVKIDHPNIESKIFTCECSDGSNALKSFIEAVYDVKQHVNKCLTNVINRDNASTESLQVLDQAMEEVDVEECDLGDRSNFNEFKRKSSDSSEDSSKRSKMLQ